MSDSSPNSEALYQLQPYGLQDPLRRSRPEYGCDPVTLFAAEELFRGPINEYSPDSRRREPEMGRYWLYPKIVIYRFYLHTGLNPSLTSSI